MSHESTKCKPINASVKKGINKILMEFWVLRHYSSLDIQKINMYVHNSQIVKLFCNKRIVVQVRSIISRKFIVQNDEKKKKRQKKKKKKRVFYKQNALHERKMRLTTEKRRSIVTTHVCLFAFMISEVIRRTYFQEFVLPHVPKMMIFFEIFFSRIPKSAERQRQRDGFSIIESVGITYQWHTFNDIRQ